MLQQQSKVCIQTFALLYIAAFLCIPNCLGIRSQLITGDYVIKFERNSFRVQLWYTTGCKALQVKPPRVKESAVQLECKVKHIYDTTNSKGVTTGAIIIAEILLLHIHEAVAGKSPQGKTIVDIDKYEPIARLGGVFYCRVKEVFELPRPNEEQLSKRQQEYHEQTGESAKHTVDPPQEGDAK